MKFHIQRIRILYVVLLFAMTTGSVSAQPLQQGEAVATCYSGRNASNTDNVDGFVIGILDVRNPLPPLHRYWTSPPPAMRHSSNWKASRLGQVFGIAIDKRGLIYTTATRAYFGQVFKPFPYDYINDNFLFGDAGPGGIYQIDPTTGAVHDLVTSATWNTTSVLGTKTIPNGNGMVRPFHGPGLGNITYDPVHDKLFVTNMEDGKIYQIEADPLVAVTATSGPGTVLSVFDPADPDIRCGNTMGLDIARPGFAPIGELLWGIGYNAFDNRVYYGVWTEDVGQPGTTVQNNVRSVGLIGSGANVGQIDPSTDRYEFCLPSLTTGHAYSMPVSDIEFSGDGKKMLLAERSAQSIMGPAQNETNIHGAYAHQSRTLEYVHVGGVPAWQFDKQISVGGGDAGGLRANSAGGVDYGYGTYDDKTNANGDCDSVVWSSGDYLFRVTPVTGNDWVYGLQRAPEAGNAGLNWPLTGPFIDFDGVLQLGGDKTEVGDVDIWRARCDQTIDSCSGRISLKPQGAGSPGNCCWEISLNNPVANTFLAIEAEILSDGATFSGASAAAGWTTDLLGFTTLVQSPIGAGFLPAGSGINAGTFCLNLTDEATTPQVIRFTWIGINGVSCTQTVEVNCAPPIENNCISIIEPAVTCTSSGESGSIYSISFKIRNDAAWPIDELEIAPDIADLTLSPSHFWVSPAIQPGQTSNVYTLEVTGLSATADRQFCLVIHAHDTNSVMVSGVLEIGRPNCCQEVACFTLPECENCCNGFDINHELFSMAYDATGNVTLNTSIAAGAEPISAVSATIVSSTLAQQCSNRQPQGTVFGDVHDGTIGVSLPGPVLAPMSGPSHELSWGTTIAGVSMTAGTPLTLNMRFPPPPCRPLWGGAQYCSDTLRFSVRFRFTDALCRTCDTVISYELIRGSQLCPIHVDTIDYDYSDDVIAPRIGTLRMSSPNQGILTLTLPALDPGQDPSTAISLSNLTLAPAVGVAVIELVDDATGTAARIVNRTAEISASVRQSSQAQSRRYRVQFDNHGSQTSFVNYLSFALSDAGSPGDTVQTIEELLAVTPAAQGGDVLARDSSDVVRNVRTYALYFRNANKLGRDVSRITLSVTGEQEILAVGPFRDRHSVVVSSWDSTAVAGAGEVDGNEVVLAPGAMVKPIYLTIAGGVGKDVTVYWTTHDEHGVLTQDSLTITDPLSIIRIDDDDDLRSGAYLFSPVPNPAATTTSFQIHLDRSSTIDVTVTDQRGRVVDRVVVGESFESGEHVLVYSTAGLDSGSYFVTLRSESGTTTQSLKVVR